MKRAMTLQTTGRCGICRTPLGWREPLRACPECRTPFHERCYIYVGRCAVYGCAPRPVTVWQPVTESPAVPAPRTIRRDPAPVSMWSSVSFSDVLFASLVALVTGIGLALAGWDRPDASAREPFSFQEVRLPDLGMPVPPRIELPEPIHWEAFETQLPDILPLQRPLPGAASDSVPPVPTLLDSGRERDLPRVFDLGSATELLREIRARQSASRSPQEDDRSQR